MKAIILFILAYSFFVTAGAQPNPDTLWTRIYGGSSYDYAKSVQQTTDGGYIAAGVTRSFGAGATDCYLVKTNSLGDIIWMRTYGGDHYDHASSVQQTTDEGYILAGFAMSFTVGNGDCYLIKTDSQGDTLWTRTYGGSGDDFARSVQQTADGGYIMAGFVDSLGAGGEDFYLVKTDSQGDSLWTHTYGGSSDDEANSVQQTVDGGYIVAGFTYSFGAGEKDFYLVKTDSLGDTLWTRTFGGSNYDEAASVLQTADGDYVVAGYSGSFAEGDYDYYLIKTDSQGDTLWTRTYGGSQGEMANCVRQTTDGGYILSGITYSFGAQYGDFYLVKTDSQGSTMWTYTYGGSDEDKAYSAQQTADGGYIMAGNTCSFGDLWGDLYLVKTGPEPQSGEPIGVSMPEQYILYPNFPNPFNASTQIVYELPKAGRVSLNVYNLLGEEVANLVDCVQAAGRQTVVFDGSGLASGVYLYRLQAEGFTQTKKMVLLK